MITEDQIRLEAYYYAEADDFTKSSEFYWNLAKEQLELENMSFEEMQKVPNKVASFTKDTMIKCEVILKRQLRKCKYEPLPDYINDASHKFWKKFIEEHKEFLNL